MSAASLALSQGRVASRDIGITKPCQDRRPAALWRGGGSQGGGGGGRTPTGGQVTRSAPEGVGGGERSSAGQTGHVAAGLPRRELSVSVAHKPGPVDRRLMSRSNATPKIRGKSEIETLIP